MWDSTAPLGPGWTRPSASSLTCTLRDVEACGNALRGPAMSSSHTRLRLAEFGDMTLKNDRATAHMSQLEDEVQRLQREALLLREEQTRWDELREAGVPRREAAAIDCSREHARKAAVKAAAAREADNRAFAEQKECEIASRSCDERVRQAAEAARRAEERATAVRESLMQWKLTAERKVSETQMHQDQVKAQAEAQLATVQGDAAARASSAEAHLLAECARTEAEFSQELSKLERHHAILQERAEDRRRRARRQVEAADASVAAAEAKRDRQVEAAEARAYQSARASQSKVNMADTTRKTVGMRTMMRLQQAHDERGLRLEAALKREAHAVKERDESVQQADARIEAAEHARVVVFREFDEVEREHAKRVEAYREQMTSKIEEWKMSVAEAETMAVEKVGGVQELADELRVMLLLEVEGLKLQSHQEERRLHAGFEEHKRVLENIAVKKRAHTLIVSVQAQDRVEAVKQLTNMQLGTVEQRGMHIVCQADEEFDGHRTALDARVRQAEHHLAKYLDSTSQDADLEVWIPSAGLAD